ncbi:hypothetical protein A2715_03460 [Candidatus Woesebacteria bacterium RIFCSPHIGHO2_01_FULL_39_32]|uniref:Histidine kinase n=1 Tax=Candidatus Woesebacteria bacterium RIFCSPLOWO2_01_FULL_39_25 TaxID=1802521 RepID=A0A1F8BKQ7_9BACT|nr:MAG: hypothetical protein A2715_03460 [Candidatus Woesebacteria bacterium RIFCSPHIGHO2_01_FULL_39_32]OGM37118.1 MAG: hypothetical protein A3F01_05400 [Candidatus Woesebacteria bacterium RIFCSPHIGHO2_12_FULL_38_11]OGM64623.1 MAG: hypothetical protein A2893_06375 [Candidatus Woesebacteria bacterium RIFCSPLOWO2_01_FULL_39_25]
MRKIDFRQKQIKLRKKFFPTLIITVFLWLLVGLVVYFVDPENYGSIPLLFFLFFLALLFTLSTLFANTRRGLIATCSITVFLILRYLGVGNIINFLLLLGLAIASEFYFSRSE